MSRRLQPEDVLRHGACAVLYVRAGAAIGEGDPTRVRQLVWHQATCAAWAHRKSDAASIEREYAARAKIAREAYRAGRRSAAPTTGGRG